MSLRQKPHSVTVEALTEDVDADGFIETPGYAASETVLCQLTPERPGTVYENTGLTLKRPHLLMCELDDASKFPLGARVTYDGREFYVQTPVEKWEQGNTTDHASVIIAENQYESA